MKSTVQYCCLVPSIVCTRGSTGLPVCTRSFVRWKVARRHIVVHTLWGIVRLWLLHLRQHQYRQRELQVRLQVHSHLRHQELVPVVESRWELMAMMLQ